MPLRPVDLGDSSTSSTILVVDDDPGVRTLTARSLLGLPYRVLQAEHGAAAADILRVHAAHVDLVLTDLVMPVMNGRELADLVVHEWPHVSLLFMSGYAGDDVLGRGLIAPGTPFLRKPFTPAVLQTAIRSMLAA